MDILKYQIDRLLPTLRKLGYDGEPAFTTARGQPFAARVEITDPERGLTQQPGVVLYDTDAYPVTTLEEACLNVWSWIGMPNKAECARIAKALTDAGIPARVTKRKGVYAVAFDPGDWINAPGG